MIKCPFTANEYGAKSYCVESCAMWDENKDYCLIAAALAKYISSSDKRDNEIEDLKQQIKKMAFGFAPLFPEEEEQDWPGLQGGLSIIKNR